jgi:hypothetical protein
MKDYSESLKFDILSESNSDTDGEAEVAEGNKDNVDDLDSRSGIVGESIQSPGGLTILGNLTILGPNNQHILAATQGEQQ